MRTTGKSEITEPRLSRRSVLLTGMAAAAALGGAVPMAAMAAQATATPKTLPNMPQRNPWLTDSVYPTTHFNPAATDSVAQAGPTKGRQLKTADVKVLPTVFTCSPTLKKVGDATIIIASGCEGVRKINGSGEAFELVSFLPYPGLEALAEKATPQAIQALVDEADAAARAKDDAKIIALSQKLSDLGFSRETALNGTYNLIDKDGFHYAAYGGMKILKSTDDNDPKKPLRVAKSKDFASELPADLAKGQIITLGMTYDGHLAVAAQGGMFLLDRDLNLMGTLPFPGEAVENSICFDETATYCVTSKRMLKIVWTGSKLSTDEADGGWASEYNIATREQAIAMGSLTQSGGSGTTPTLMGFGDDPDKLVIISDGDPTGTHAVAFWRDKIPDDFRQRPGTKVPAHCRPDPDRHFQGHDRAFTQCAWLWRALSELPVPKAGSRRDLGKRDDRGPDAARTDRRAEAELEP